MKKVIIFFSLFCIFIVVFFLIFNIFGNKNTEKINENVTKVLPEVEEDYEMYKIIFDDNLKSKTKEQIEEELINKQAKWKKIIQKYGGKDIVDSTSSEFIIFAKLQPNKAEELKQNKEIKEIGQIYPAQ